MSVSVLPGKLISMTAEIVSIGLIPVSSGLFYTVQTAQIADG